MKKHILNIACLLMALTAATANANQGQVLNCADATNKLQVRILPVSGDPSLRVVSLNGDLLIVGIDPQGNDGIGKTAHVEGHLVGTSSEDGFMTVSGLIENQEGSEMFINPGSAYLTLVPRKDGSTTLIIVDEDNIFQLGFGLHMSCK